MLKKSWTWMGLVVFLSSWGIQERYSLLPPSPKAGDQEKVTLQGSFDISLSVEVRQGETKVEESGFTGKGHTQLQFRREVTDVSGGSITSVYTLEDVLAWVEGEMKKGAEPAERIRRDLFGSLRGSRLALTGGEKGIESVRVLSGNVSEADLSQLRRYLQTSQLRLLPSRSVGVGETWRVEGEALYGLLREVSDEGGKIEPRRAEGAIVGRLERISEGWAYVSFSGAATVEYEVVRDSPLVRARAKVSVDGSRWQINLTNPSEARATLSLVYDIQGETIGGEVRTFVRTQLKALYNLDVKSL
ncbi:MAG: hypothetical protein K6T17_00805 [Fimbriimonadales bacterium]|nr:hypothetical protein [Fimbriimonadales bacterium]